MNVLVVDNGSHFISELLNSLYGNKITTIRTKNLNKIKINNIDKIILSGGNLSVKYHKKDYVNEIKLIKESKIPILGICLGCELIASTFGEKLERMDVKEREILKVSKIKKDKLMNGLDNFKVFESHRWIVKKCQKLIPLAKSDKGIEVFKHPKKEIYGVQFHPEMFHRKTQGKIILKNFLNM